MAEDANQQGNKFYKAGDLVSAIQWYDKAEKSGQGEPKYASNLSAAQYEHGQYELSIQSIIRSWKVLQSKSITEPSTIAFKVKLATRFAKANLHGSLANQLSSLTRDDTGETIHDIEAFVTGSKVLEEEKKVEEMKDAWAQFKALQSALQEQGAQGSKEAKRRLRNTRFFKHPSDPTLELYKFGHDEIRSLLDLEDAAKIKFGSSSQAASERLSFYFGGSGDSRHVFGTLLDVADSVRTTRKKEKNYVPPQLHMTLVDIHPAVVAKTLLIMELIHRLDQLEGDFKAQMSVQTTLAFLYVSLAMPDYCAQMISEIALEYVKKITNASIVLPSWLSLRKHNEDKVVAALLYWATPLEKSTEALLKAHSRHQSHGQGLMLHGHMPMPGSPANFDPKTEDKIYDALGIQLPPKPFQSRHPALEKLIKSYRTMPAALVNAAKKEVYGTWKPNPTIFDKISTEHHMLYPHKGYPTVTMTPYQTLFTLQTWNQRLEPGPVLPLGANSFGIQAEFFRHVVEAIHYLHAEGKLQIELVCSDAISGLAKLVAGDLGPRPDTFPRSFTRMWLSNVPDYTNGILNMAVHLVPYQNKLSSFNATSANCLLNTSVFANLNEFCYNYTLLDAEDLPRFLGCQVTSRSLNQVYTLKPLSMPRPLSALAPKGRLHAWLSRLFVCTLISGLSQALPHRVDLPNNIHAFIALLAYLPSVGFPAHWISEFMTMIVEDRLVTDALPYEGKLPIPTSYQLTKVKERKVCLAVWRAELESIVSQVWPALPFFVPMKRSSVTGILEHPKCQDIKTLRAKVVPIDFVKHPNFREWMQLLSPFAPTMALVFLRPQVPVGIDKLLPKLSLFLEGGGSDSMLRTVVEEGLVQIMLGAETIYFPEMGPKEGLIEWKMSKSWYERMKAEEWQVFAYRTDLKVASSEPMVAKHWEEI